MRSVFSTSYVIYLTIYSFISLSSCDGRKSEGLATNPTQRTGNSLSSVDIKYVDTHPSLSADGLKIVYVSGKDDTVLRARRSTRSAGAAFAASTRLATNSGLTAEQVAMISPNGSNVLIYGLTATGNALVLCDFLGATCSTLTTEPWSDSSFGFSSDSQAIYYLKGTKASGGTLVVAASSTPTTSIQIGSSDQWLHALWIPQTSGFKLIAADRSSTAGKTNLKSYSFSNIAAASSASSQTIVTDFPFGSDLSTGPLGGLSGTTTASSVLTFRPVKLSSAPVFAEMGNVTYNADTNPQRKINLLNQNFLYSMATGAATATTTVGIKTAQAFLASDGSTIFSLNMVAGRCNTEDAPTYGSALAVTNNSSGANSWKYFKYPTDLGQAPISTDSFCDRTVSGTTTATDLSTSAFTVNAGATSTAYTLAWVSNMTGDPEIFAMDVSASGTSVWTVSGNRK